MSIKVLIIEDEQSAAKHLLSLLKKMEVPTEVIAVIATVAEAVQWLRQHSEPDLILSDIQLSDGLSFDILEEVRINCAIIYTTAYDQYAIQAFKTTGIDYLLKPITAHDLQFALQKYQQLQHHYHEDQLLKGLDILLQRQAKDQPYKSQFLLKSGNALEPVATADIAYFYREELVFARNFAGKNYLMDASLNHLQTQLDPNQFLRLNRQLLVNKISIKRLIPTKPGRLQVEVDPNFQQAIHLSQERSSWLRDVLEG